MNRFREGIVTEEDENVLNSRVSSDQYLDTTTLHIFYTNLEVAEHNEKMLNTLETPLVTIKAKNSGPGKNYRPDKTKDGRIGSTQFLDILNVKVGARCALTWNLSTVDGLVNGSSGTIVAIEINKMSAEKKVEAIIVRFDDESAGKSQREKHPRLAKKYEQMKGTPILRLTHEYNIMSKKGFSLTASARIEQFPIKIYYASTAHKIQGQTVKAGSKVVIHWNKNMGREKGMSYVMLGRTQVLEDIHIVGSVDFKSIQCSENALSESKRLFKIFEDNEMSQLEFLSTHWMISYLNVRSLKGHKDDVLKDNFLMASDIIGFGETWLEQTDTVNIDNFEAVFVNAGKGKGVATYSKLQSISQPLTFKSETFSAILISTDHFNILSMYLSHGQNSSSLCEEIREILQKEKPMIVMGDMNMNTNSRNDFQDLLSAKGFRQMITEPTFDGGSLIDHIYVNEELLKIGCVTARNSVYYSDHDVITVFVKKQD